MPYLEELTDRYFDYIRIEKGLSRNTVESYAADLSRYVGLSQSQPYFEYLSNRRTAYSQLSYHP